MSLIAAMTGSPRMESFSSHLLRVAVEPLSALGWERATLDTTRPDIAFCSGCGTCHDTATCCHNDMLTAFYKRLENADALIAASPIYFRGLSAQFKRAVDRAQPLWLRRERHPRRGDDPYGTRPSALILTAGGAGIDTVYAGAEATFRCLCACLGFARPMVLRVPDTDTMGNAERAAWVRRAETLAGHLATLAPPHSPMSPHP